MKDIFPKIQSIILRKLYLTKYKKGFFINKCGSINDFIEEMNLTDVNYSYQQKVLRNLIEKGVLVFNCVDEHSAYYHVNQDTLWRLLQKDKIFKLDEQIITDRSIIQLEK